MSVGFRGGSTLPNGNVDQRCLYADHLCPWTIHQEGHADYLLADQQAWGNYDNPGCRRVDADSRYNSPGGCGRHSKYPDHIGAEIKPQCLAAMEVRRSDVVAASIP